MKRALLLILTSLGCVTPYQPNGFGGGYWETDVGGGIVAIHFRGNGRTSSDLVTDYAMQRASEYCQEEGKSGYEIVNSNSSVKSIDLDDDTTCKGGGSNFKCKTDRGGSIKKHTATLYIRCTDPTPP